MNWIPHPTILTGERVELVPFERIHIDELIPLTKDKSLFEFFPVDYSDTEKFLASCEEVLTGRENGTYYPFVIKDKASQKIIGSTMLFDIYPIDRKLEIGRTWLIATARGGGINAECKLLLLTFCFETLKTVRVQLKATEKNLRSRRAIEKIGAKYEGTIRKERAMPNGTFRNTVVYSILDDEWREAKEKIIASLK